MSESYILILGAGLMQRPSIEAARELGYKSLVVDGNPYALCAGFADRFEPVDLKDKEGLVNLARSLGKDLAAVFTAGTDFSASVSYVAEHCGLHAHSYEAACNASDKTRMRSCFAAAGVPSPSFCRITKEELPTFLSPEKLASLRFPKVVKPVDNMGARGCRLIRDASEFAGALTDAVAYSRSGTAILEDYMAGPEFSIDALVFDGTLTITGFADRHIFYEPYFIEMGHTMPSSIDEGKRRELIQCFAKGIQALGLRHGVAKADIKYTAKGPMIGEIAARLSGGYMSGWTYPYASGLFLTKEAMLLALGKKPEELLSRRVPVEGLDAPFAVYDVPCGKTCAERAWISIPGKVQDVLCLQQAKDEPFVRDVLPRVRAGEAVDFPRNNVEKCGNCLALAADRELAAQAAEKAVSSIILRLKANERRTEDFLFGKEKAGERSFPPDAYTLSDGQLAALMAVLREVPRIGRNVPVSFLWAEHIADFADNVKDFNHRSLTESLDAFDEICPLHTELDSFEFWKKLLRGGLQGIVYYADCMASAEETV